MEKDLYIQELGEGFTLFIVGIAILIVLVLSTSNIEKSLRTIEKQNASIIELLTDIRDEK